jgi:hypothetical protein
VDRAVRVLKDLIGDRNQLIHLYVHEAVVTCSMYSHMKKALDSTTAIITTTATHDSGTPTTAVTSVNKQALLSDINFLSQWFKVEFIFKPGRVGDNLEDALSILSTRHILDWDSDAKTNIQITDIERRSGYDLFRFHCSFLWPFIESYWLAVLSVYAMSATAWITEKTWLKYTQQLGQTLYYEGDLTYFESINRDTLQNASNRLVEIGVLEKSDPAGAFRPMPTYAKCIIIEDLNVLQRDALHELIEDIGRFRREGRNRRDNANLNQRLLRLARLAGLATSSKL